MKTIHDENKIRELFYDDKSWSDNMKEYAEYMVEKNINEIKEKNAPEIEKNNNYIKEIRKKTIDECIACVPKPETDPAYYQSEQVMGLNFAIEQTITNLNNLKNNETK